MEQVFDGILLDGSCQLDLVSRVIMSDKREAGLWGAGTKVFRQPALAPGLADLPTTRPTRKPSDRCVGWETRRYQLRGPALRRGARPGPAGRLSARTRQLRQGDEETCVATSRSSKQYRMISSRLFSLSGSKFFDFRIANSLYGSLADCSKELVRTPGSALVIRLAYQVELVSCYHY